MSEEPTPGELRRTIDDLRNRHTMHEQRVDSRLDAMAKDMVPSLLFQAHLETSRREKDELAKDIADLAARFDADQRQRSADRRMILIALWTSILAPLVILMISTYLRGKGTAP